MLAAITRSRVTLRKTSALVRWRSLIAASALAGAIACQDTHEDAAPAASDLRAIITDAERSSRVAELRTNLSTLRLWNGKSCDDRRLTTEYVHDLGDYALAQLVLGVDDAGSVATSALECMLGFQVVDTNDSANLGVFPFHVQDNPNPKDNPTEFAMLPLATILTVYRDQLDPGFFARADGEPSLNERLRWSLDAIERHVACPEYTNICLMQAAVMLGVGKYLNETGEMSDDGVTPVGASYVASGRGRLSEWLERVERDGVKEFNSPTYTEVSVECLLSALRVSDDETRPLVLRALDVFWRQIAAHTAPTRGTLTGPMSRTYDFFFAEGGVAQSMYIEGPRASAPGNLSLIKALLLLNAESPDGYRPPRRILAVSKAFPREVTRTFRNAVHTGEDSASELRESYAWITRDFALGTSNTDYGTSVSSAQDEMVRADFAASPTTAGISVLSDYLDGPGTKVSAGDFSKVTHVMMSPVAAQLRGSALVTFAVAARNPLYTVGSTPLSPKSLTTNFTFPVAQAGEELVVLDREGHVVGDVPDLSDTSSPEKSLDRGATVVVRIGDGAIAMTFVDAGGLECPLVTGMPKGGFHSLNIARFALGPLQAAKANGNGAVARFYARHASNDELPRADDASLDDALLKNCFARAAVLMVGDHCNSSDAGCATGLGRRVAAAAAAANVTYDEITRNWSVSVQADAGTQLYVHRNPFGFDTKYGGNTPSDTLPTPARLVNGNKMSFVPFSVRLAAE